MNRNIPVVASVLLLHVLALWALQTGLLRRAVEMIIPVQLLATLVEPPKAEVVPPRATPAPPPKPVVKLQKPVEPTPVAPLEAPAPVPILATAGPSSLTIAQAPATTAPIAPPAPVGIGSTRTGAVGPVSANARIELPSSDAAYLQNPRPPYPSMSKRLNEQGTVRLSVLIGVDGLAQKAEIRQSSGFDRLDKVALETVLKWRYLPGKRDGVPEAMWFVVPLVFALE